jgi:NAD(P)-dependent dehydrogenase (short-subunit alcohol dehydrogenase family)
MGCAISHLFAAEGAKVLAVARDGDALRAAHAGRAGIEWLAQDISDPAVADRIVAQAADLFGGIDIVVNAAGSFEMDAIDEIAEDVWARAFATNFHGPRALCLAALPFLKRSGVGRIINVGSVSVHLTQPGMAAYNASKHALAGLTQSLAVELGRFGITANILHPGFILTDMTRVVVEDSLLATRMNGKIALGRIGTVDEIAFAALSIADPRSSYTTGQAIRVDGGYGAGVYDMF